MDKKKSRQTLFYLFIALSMITAVLAYTIESWRWGAAAFTVGFLLIAVITLVVLRKDGEDEAP